MLIILTMLSSALLFGQNLTCNQTTYSGPIPDVGYYQRVDPSGRYILTSARSAEFIDLADMQYPKIIKTPMNDEVYPVEPDWRLLASPNHSGDGMRYYYFDQKDSGVINHTEEVPAAFNDPDHNEYYHTSAAFESDKTQLKFRTVFRDMRARDYEVKFDESGKAIEHSKSKTYNICENVVFENSKLSAEKIAELQKIIADLDAKIFEKRKIMDKRSLVKPVSRGGYTIAFVTWHQTNALIREREKVARELILPERISTPILSKDGKELMAYYRGATRIFEIDSKGKCKEVLSLPFQTGKGSFAYPINGKNRFVVFQGSSHLVPAETRRPGSGKTVGLIYDRETNEIRELNTDLDVDIVGYLGFTKDNKVIYPIAAKGPSYSDDQKLTYKIAVTDPFSRSCGAQVTDFGAGKKGSR